MDDELEVVAPQTTEEAEVETKESKTDAEPVYTESEKKLFERLSKEKARTADLKKELAATKLEKDRLTKKDPQPDTEELRLIAKGFTDEEIDEAKSIAKGRDINLSEAVKTKSFQLFQSDLKETARKEKAKLGATKGSGQEDELIIRPGMSRDEHKAEWQKMTGK